MAVKQLKVMEIVAEDLMTLTNELSKCSANRTQLSAKLFFSK